MITRLVSRSMSYTQKKAKQETRKMPSLYRTKFKLLILSNESFLNNCIYLFQFHAEKSRNNIKLILN